MPDIKRRKVLKGLSATTAAVMAPLSLHAAKPVNSNQHIAMYIDARHGRFKNSTSNEIINTSNQAIVLNTKEPVGYKDSNGQYISLYINSSDETHTFHPGERLPVYARATMIKPPAKMAIQNKLVENSISIA